MNWEEDCKANEEKTSTEYFKNILNTWKKTETIKTKGSAIKYQYCKHWL